MVSQHNNRGRTCNPDTIAVAKPTALSLLGHIIRATVLDGMQWPVLLCIAMASCLYYFNIAYHDSIAILIITGIIVIGMVRGCSAWQNDLNDYQQQLAMSRRQPLNAENTYIIPGYYPSRRY